MKRKRFLFDLLLILLGSALYAFSTVAFVFPAGLLLGGTSGISVILNAFLPFSPGMILSAINLALILLAFLILGKGMAAKTLIGSLATTVLVALFERLIPTGTLLIANPYLAALVGAAIIAVASGVMFYVDSSSGGTDIIALIVKKFAKIKIGRALLATDVLIVVAGGLLSRDLTVFFSSVLGLLVKTLGIDLVIGLIKRLARGKRGKDAF